MMKTADAVEIMTCKSLCFLHSSITARVWCHCMLQSAVLQKIRTYCYSSFIDWKMGHRECLHGKIHRNTQADPNEAD